MSTCPRTITDSRGRRRTVRCRSWACPMCAEIKQRQIMRAALHTFVAGESLAVRLRARAGESQHGYKDDLAAVWKRVRTRLPGMRYIAVHERDPDGHLHALIAHVDAETLSIACAASGAIDVYVEPVRDLGDYVMYMLAKRANAAAPRIMHSRDITKSLAERMTHAEHYGEEARDEAAQEGEAAHEGEAAQEGEAQQESCKGEAQQEGETRPGDTHTDSRRHLRRAAAAGDTTEATRGQPDVTAGGDRGDPRPARRHQTSEPAPDDSGHEDRDPGRRDQRPGHDNHRMADLIYRALLADADITITIKIPGRQGKQPEEEADTWQPPHYPKC